MGRKDYYHLIERLCDVLQLVITQSNRPTTLGYQNYAQNAKVLKIARCMYLHPATVVGILDRLEKQKLVIRIRSTEDHSVVRVVLGRPHVLLSLIAHSPLEIRNAGYR